MTFSEKVLELRGQMQITQMQLAKLLGVSYSTVNRWECGHYEATKLVKHKFEALCKKHSIVFDKNTYAEQNAKKT
jgi:transcriptional regulator with XRE-family HTH domain